jgi:HK97 family phage prohead protease
MSTLHRRLYGGEGYNRVFWSPADVEEIIKRYGGRMVTAYSPPTVMRALEPAKAGTSSDAVYSFVASTSSIDRAGDTLSQQGWHLGQFKRNPVILWSHDQSSLPIGRATQASVQGDRLIASIKFANTRHANAVEKSVKAGTLNAVSVGFRPLRWKFSNDDSRDRGIDFHEMELLELSLCAVPANADCLMIGASGIPKTYAERKRAKRLRDLELAKLSEAPKSSTTTKRERELELAEIKAARNLSREAIDAGMQRLLELEEIREGGRHGRRR